MLSLDDMPKASGNQMKSMNDAHDKWLATQNIQAEPMQKEFQQQEYPQRAQEEYHATLEDLPAPYQQKFMPDTQNYQAPEQKQVTPLVEDEDAPVTPETKREYNTRMLREEKERLAQENKELRKWQQQMYQQQQYQNKQPESHMVVEDDYADVGDEELLEGSKVKHILRKQEERMQRKFEQAVDQRMSQLQQETSMLKVNSSFPDFDKVVTQDNVEMLERLDPELADIISREPDMYKLKKTIYNQIKRMGIYKEDVYVQQKNVAHTNSMKPKPSSVVSPQQGSTPMQQANAFANGKPSADYHREMMEQMRNARRSS